MLQRITSQIQHEDVKLAAIARQTQKESKRVQVLSTVATVYLPASLIAVRRTSSSQATTAHLYQTIFSSSLLQMRANDVNDPAKGSHIVISSQFWIFVVTSICLAAVTLAYPLLWDRRLSRVSPWPRCMFSLSVSRLICCATSYTSIRIPSLVFGYGC